MSIGCIRLQGRAGASKDQGENKLVCAGQGGAKPGPALGPGSLSHRIVGGLVARCRDEGHLERLGWGLVLRGEMQALAMVAGGRWLLYLRKREWLAGQGPWGPSPRYPSLTSFSRAPSCVLSFASVTGNQPEPGLGGWGFQIRLEWGAL